MRRVALYARYSSDLQDDRSIVDQVSLLRAFAARQEGWEIVAERHDAARSGASLHNRPGLRALIDEAEAGRFDVVLAESLDRFGRDIGDVANLHKRLAYRGVQLHTVADGGEVPRLMVGIKGAIAEFYLADLAAKTRRGQLGRVKAGRIPGGRCYGYDVVRDGDRGRRVINAREAEIVRRIYGDYVAGVSPLRIVQALNAEGIPGPRGGAWNTSSLIGSAKRKNGLLNNSLYCGRITYNRQRFVKDPEKGKRRARANPVSEWVAQDVPELAIVDADMWQAAQDLRANRAPERRRPEYQRRPKHLLSGLLVCGSCGASMIVRLRKKKEGITYFGCSARVNRRTCDNERTVPAPEIERRVLEGLRKYLSAPDVIAAAVETYREDRQRLSREAARERGELERELAATERAIDLVMRAVMDGADTKITVPKLNALSAKKDELQARLAAALSADVVELHPQAAERYAARVADIHTALAKGDQAGLEAVAIVGELVKRITIIAAPRGQPVGLELQGDLAALLNVNVHGTPVMATMVAGVGFEPTTFRL